MRMSERLIGSSARCQTLEKRQRKNPISCASGAEIGKWSERDFNLGLPFSFMVLAKNSFSDYEKSNRRGRFCKLLEMIYRTDRSQDLACIIMLNIWSFNCSFKFLWVQSNMDFFKYTKVENHPSVSPFGAYSAPHWSWQLNLLERNRQKLLLNCMARPFWYVNAHSNSQIPKWAPPPPPPQPTPPLPSTGHLDFLRDSHVGVDRSLVT